LGFLDEHEELEHLLATALYAEELPGRVPFLSLQMRSSGLSARHVRALAAMEAQAEKANARAWRRRTSECSWRPRTYFRDLPRPRRREIRRRRSCSRRARSPGRLP